MMDFHEILRICTFHVPKTPISLRTYCSRNVQTVYMPTRKIKEFSWHLIFADAITICDHIFSGNLCHTLDGGSVPTLRWRHLISIVNSTAHPPLWTRTIREFTTSPKNHLQCSPSVVGYPQHLFLYLFYIVSILTITISFYAWYSAQLIDAMAV